MPLDISLIREEKGGNVEKVLESQRARFKPEQVIHDIIAEDKEWRKLIFEQDTRRKHLTQQSKLVGEKKKAKEDASDLILKIKELKDDIEKHEVVLAAAKAKLDSRWGTIGNIVHSSVPNSKDEKHNIISAKWGECRASSPDLLHHHELLAMIDGYDPERGAIVAGHRGYFLKDAGVLLNQALVNFGLAFLRKRQYNLLQPPYFMNKEIMAETAQLEEFDEALYKVVGSEGDGDKYLIATSEQPISAYHRNEWLQPEELPKRYGGVSTCFRKEAGSHGRDAWGIFRIHQFEKIEQFCITSPEKSWEMHEEMIKIAQEFYQELGLPYRVVTIVSGELNNAAAKKYDLEAWFPTLAVYRELVSASNCTDYQARAMETRYGQKKMGQREKAYVHMLNATLCATERTICCILENYQTDKGVKVPAPLIPYCGVDFFPFVKPKPVNKAKEKAERAQAKKEKTTEA